MGTAKSGGEVEITEYAMSLHIGICAYGDGIELLSVEYGDKEIWRGVEVNEGVFPINKPDLFGGDKKEGGVKGLLWWLPGKVTQIMPESLAAKLGLTSATCPGFRGLSSIFVTGTSEVGESSLSAIIAGLAGNPSNNRKGFYLAANNPYLRKFKARLRRKSVGLNPAYALIRIENDSLGNWQYASNPGGMIYECLTNTDWGLGENPNVIDKGSFEGAAFTLYQENFGLSMIWTRQSKIESFIGEILNHIQGALFVNPATGKHTLKLLRGDYVVENLPLITPSNAQLSSFKRKAWGEIANEISVNWTNPETGKEETVVAQDLAAIAAEGGVISSSRRYYGVTSKALALELAERDLAASVNPIATCEAEVTREFWQTNTSDVVRLNWPEYNIDQIVFRVGEAKKTGNTVQLSLYEDIFGLDRANYLGSGGTGWVNPSQPPSPASYYQVGTAPAFLTAMALDLNSPADLEYPEALAAVTVGADSDDDVNYDLISYLTDVNGTVTQASLGAREYRGTWSILGGLVAEAQTLLASLPGLRGPEPVAGDFILIGTGIDENTEIATVQSVSSSGYLLNRGMLDTVPRAWEAGTRAFVIPIGDNSTDLTVRSAFEETSYWFLTRTTAGKLPLADAPQVNVSVSERPYFPNRPANVKVNTVGFGTVDATAAANLTVTWANRNRLTEASQVQKWTDASVAPEAGQTTKIVVSTPAGVPIVTHSGLTGASKVIALSEVSGHTSVVIRVTAERDGYESLQGHSLAVSLP